MRPRHVTAATAFALLILTTAVGCSDADSTWGDELTGIYTVESLTENSETCDAEGGSVLKDDRDHMVVFSGSDAGGRWVRADGCADPAGCRKHAQDVLGNRGWAVTFEFIFREDKGDHLEGGWTTTGYSGGGPLCTEGEVTTFSLTAPSETAVRVESRSVVVDYPPDADGICWTTGTAAAAAGKPCNRLRTAAAQRVEAL